MLQLNSRIPSEIDIMAQLESLIKKTSFTSFVRKFLSPTVQSTDTLFASGSCTPTKVHFPYTDQMTPLNRDDGGLLPDAYLHLARKKGS